MGAEQAKPEGEGKPEYQTPLTYEVRDFPSIWKAVTEETGKYLRVGPVVGTVANAPTLFLGDGNDLSFGLNLKPSFAGNLVESTLRDNDKIRHLSETLQKYLGEELRVKPRERKAQYNLLGLVISKVTTTNGKEEEREVATFNQDNQEFRFIEHFDEPVNEEQGRDALEQALKLFQITTSELYRLNGLEVPEEKVIIEPPERDKKINATDLKELMKFFREDKLKNHEKIYFSPTREIIPLPTPTPDHPASTETPRPGDKLDEIRQSYAKNQFNEIKKLFGTGGSSDLETLRQSIIVEGVPDITFDSIGGQAAAVEQARLLAEQLKHPEAFARWGSEPPRGIIFIGDPGNGKTLIAKALAHEAEVPFIMVKSSDLASKWYGDAEKLAKGVFQIAREEAMQHGGHAIIYFDEVDSLMPSRKGNVHEATRRVIGTVLQEIDGLQTQEQEGKLIVIASTNTPETVDDAFLSRMTEWVEVPSPDAQGISEILAIQFQAQTVKAGRELLQEGIDFSQVASEMVGVSGRDIADVVQRVLSLKGQQEARGLSPTVVTKEDIQSAIVSSAKVRQAKLNHRKATSGQIGFRNNSEKPS